MSLKSKPQYKRVAQLKTPEAFSEHCQTISANIPFDLNWSLSDDNKFSEPHFLNSGFKIGNRFCILPMEGWDCTSDGKPTEHTIRRWNNFGLSGAKLIWGCEAVAVQHSGRANPHQLLINEENLPSIQNLYDGLIETHKNKFGTTDDLLVGLQLTHSGRYSRPNSQTKPEPLIVYNHPILDKKMNLKEDFPTISDSHISKLIEDFVQAAVCAQKIGFQFVDIKHCHGYLAHEILTGYNRQGDYGGDLFQRTQFLRSIVEGIWSEAPELEIAVRLSAFDFVPFRPNENNIGVPSEFEGQEYKNGFGGGASGKEIDLQETFALLKIIEELGIELVCITAGSPYYNPHIQRPALFPPSDGYLPPEDPLVGVARQINATAQIKKAFPNLTIIGSAYSYLQEWLPNVAHEVLLNNMADFVGLGRMVLSYPEMPVNMIKGESLKRTKICRTFSDCTTAPRNGLISGCFPLDPYYKELPEHDTLKEFKKNG